MNNSLNDKAKPFLKWAGGKAFLLPHLEKLIPTKFNSYFEPFLGGGALFFHLKPKSFVLSDLNDDLINAYLHIKDNPEKLIGLLREMKYEKEFYYTIRGNESTDKIFRAARFIYLNKTCWNGLYRVNSQGKFNVPIGRYKNLTICNEECLRVASSILKKGNVSVSDFEDTLAKAKRGDLVYIDPPYTTSHNNNGFIEYNSQIFSLQDQIRLRSVFEKLCKKGCCVILSNADHEFIRELYKGFKRTVVSRRNTISSKINKRSAVTELIITNEGC